MIVLIAGATGGFGRVLGGLLAERGHAVYGTSRDPAQAGADVGFPLLPMEITDRASVDGCVAEVVRREGRVDVLVNCVNQMVIGATEEATVAEVQALYDVNVFGMLRVCRAVIPEMRRQGGGTIVNMSSLGGVVAIPYMGAYTSTKFAVEALSESMYHELRDDPIDVVIVRPVAMRLDRPALGPHMRLLPGVGEGSRSRGMVAFHAADTAASALTPEAVAGRVHQIITARRKPLRVPVGRAVGLSLLKRVAPQALVDRVLRELLPAGKG